MKSAAINTGNSHWFLFLISPFLAGIVAVRNYRAPWAKNVLWAFVVFYGFTFGLTKELSTGNTTADINRYAAEVKTMYKSNFSIDEIVKLYEQNDDIDILRLTIAIAVSRFTDSMNVLTAVYAFIFGFFLSRNIWFILNRVEGKIRLSIALLLIVFFLVDPIWAINGFRFNTATHIYIYGLLPYLFEKKKNGIVVSCLSFLVHFSFLIPIGILLLYVLAGNRTTIFFAVFIGSIFISEIKIGSINSFIESRAPAALSERTATYRTESKVNEFRKRGNEDVGGENKSWHARYYVKALHWTLMSFLIVLYFKRKSLEQLNANFLSSLSFTLLFWGVANILSSLPSGSRFITIAALSALPLIIFFLHYRYKDKLMINAMRFAVLPLALFSIVSIREGFYTLTINTFVGNPLLALFANYNFSLNDLIK
jgi:hypothetical protein